MRPRSFLVSLALALAVVVGCRTDTPPDDDIASTSQALSTPLNEMPQNGYPPDGIIPNHPLLWIVWQHPLDDAGVAETLGTTPSGVSTPVSSLFNTGDPRTSAEYLMDEIVSCALDSGRTVSATIGGRTFQWEGKFGLCDTGSPFGDWRTGDWTVSGDSLPCRHIVSACVLARMNARGKHVPISIRVPDPFGTYPRRFHPVDKVRAQTMLRDGTMAGSGWQPDFVGICTRGTTVTLERPMPGPGIRVCTGIHACDRGQQERIFPGSPRFYSRFLDELGAGAGPISFTCPRDASTAPNGSPERAYFSIMVSSGPGGTMSPVPGLVPMFSSTTRYPAPERDVFTYPEGAFYGELLPNPGVGYDASACYSPLWQAGRMYETDRMCTDPQEGCFHSGPCQRDCLGRSPGPDEAYHDCLSDVDLPRWNGVTVFLNEPSAMSGNPVVSAIESSHDLCTPGAPLVSDGNNGVVASVCAADPYCCSAAWDDRCIGEIRTQANSQACGTVSCTHPACTTGAPLDHDCSPVVKSVCGVDPFCCNTAWDTTCVEEVQTVANSQECGCHHPVCTTGAPLDHGCSPVVKSICGADPFCCNTAWDTTCVEEVQTVAHVPPCPCSHSVCSPGAALVTGCSPVVKSVCAADPYCCNNAWDSICVQEVQTVATSPECQFPP